MHSSVINPIIRPARVMLWLAAVAVLCCCCADLLSGAEPPEAKTEAKFVPERFVGEWGNKDFRTGGVTRVHIRMVGQELRVHMWGRCHPKECDWGEVAAAPIAGDGNSIQVVWNPGFCVTKHILTLDVDGTLRLAGETVFTDDSGRLPQTDKDTYVKGLKRDWSDP